MNKNQVATNLALGLCTLGQVAFSGLVLAPFLPALLRSHETLLATASGAATLGCTLAATATFVSVMAIRLAVLASCGFNLKEARCKGGGSERRAIGAGS